MRAEAIWRGDASGGIAAHPRFFGWEGFRGYALCWPVVCLTHRRIRPRKTVAWKGLRLEGVGCFLKALPETEAAASARRV